MPADTHTRVVAVRAAKDRMEATGTPLSVALAALLRAEASVRHLPVGLEINADSGRFAARCSCGDQSDASVVLAEPCGRLVRAHAVAQASTSGEGS